LWHTQKNTKKLVSFLEKGTFIDQITHSVRKLNWLSIMQQCQERPEGVTVKQWLADKDIKEKA
jgi:hypothetical protein